MRQAVVDTAPHPRGFEQQELMVSQSGGQTLGIKVSTGLAAPGAWEGEGAPGLCPELLAAAAVLGSRPHGLHLFYLFKDTCHWM